MSHKLWSLWEGGERCWGMRQLLLLHSVQSQIGSDPSGPDQFQREPSKVAASQLFRSKPGLLYCAKSQRTQGPHMIYRSLSLDCSRGADHVETSEQFQSWQLLIC